MKIWVDAQMSPAIATWISSNYAVSAVAIRDLGLRDAEDKEIFEAARQERAVRYDQRQRFRAIAR